jgi:hypothetical protein
MCNLSPKEWTLAFSNALSHIGDDMTYGQAADCLRQLIKTGLLRVTDIVQV